MRNYSSENDFDLHDNKTACRTHFHMKGFALRLVLKQRQERSRKWPILLWCNFQGFFKPITQDIELKKNSEFLRTRSEFSLQFVVNHLATKSDKFDFRFFSIVSFSP